MRQILSRLPKSNVLINRNFALLWTGQSISVIGDFIFDTTLVLWIGAVVAKNQPWAPLAVSGVLLMAALPAFLVGPLAGVFVDRWDKRRTMLFADGMRALLITLLFLFTGVLPLPFVTPSPIVQLLITYIIVALASICAQLFNPSEVALIGDIVPEPQRTQATSMSGIAGNLAYIIGPPLASLLFVGLGVHWAILINACSFLVSFLAILFIRVPQSARSTESGQPENFFREFLAGIQFSFRNSILRTLIVSGMAFMFGAGIINTLYYFFLAQNLHASAALYGFLVSAPGIGGVVGAAIAGKYAHRIGEAKVLGLSSVLWGVVVISLALQGNIIPATILAFLIGVLNSGIGVVVAPLLLHATSRELVGRAFATLSPSVSLASMLSIVATGYLSSTVLHATQVHILVLSLNTNSILFGIAGMLTLLSGAYVLINLRGVRLADDTAPDQEEEIVRETRESIEL